MTWPGESQRHAMSSRGVSTARGYRKMYIDQYGMSFSITVENYERFLLSAIRGILLKEGWDFGPYAQRIQADNIYNKKTGERKSRWQSLDNLGRLIKPLDWELVEFVDEYLLFKSSTKERLTGKKTGKDELKQDIKILENMGVEILQDQEDWFLKEGRWAK